MKNPSKYIRKAYLALLADIGTPIYDRRVPKDVTPIPATRVIISSQTNSPSNQTNCGRGWTCSILLDIINEQPTGYVNSATIDDIEELISNRIDLWTASHTDISIPPFTVYQTQFSDSHDIEIETQTVTIARRVIRYTHRINGLD